MLGGKNKQINFWKDPNYSIILNLPCSFLNNDLNEPSPLHGYTECIQKFYEVNFLTSHA